MKSLLIWIKLILIIFAMSLLACSENKTHDLKLEENAPPIESRAVIPLN